MFQAGLILEGGGMRGVYTAGVLDAFLENGIAFSSIYGVSAGACHASSFISKQFGRAFRSCADYVDKPEYMSFRNILRTGSMFSKEYVYSTIPNVLDPFDYETFRNYQGRFYAVLTDADTGEAVYVRVRDLKKQMWAIRASASLPLISKTTVVHGRAFLDGGIADSIPIRKSMSDGNVKNVVILTRELGYRKQPNKMMPLIKLRYPKSKGFVERAGDRYLRYNETLDFLAMEEQKGNVFVIQPDRKVEVSRTEKNRERLEALYQEGLEDGRKSIDALKVYLES